MSEKLKMALDKLNEEYTAQLAHRQQGLKVQWQALKDAPWTASAWKTFHGNVHRLAGSIGMHGYLSLSKKLKEFESLLEPVLLTPPTTEQHIVLQRKFEEIFDPKLWLLETAE